MFNLIIIALLVFILLPKNVLLRIKAVLLNLFGDSLLAQWIAKLTNKGNLTITKDKE